MSEHESGRSDLARWADGRAASFWDATPNLAHVLAGRLGEERAIAVTPSLAAFGAAVAGEIEPAVARLEADRTTPRLLARDRVGRPAEQVEFRGEYHAAGRAVWHSGVAALAATPGGAVEAAALTYLLSHCGEGGHTCPLACTAGLARALIAHGDETLRQRWLGALTSSDYDDCARGAQFVTEVQGGSDAGTNAVEARPLAGVPGAYTLHGEKWFCSVADADLFAVTARPSGAVAGTAGLGCFAVPRRGDDGAPNGFRLRRLKDKLGSRCMATGEIEFDGAVARPIGRVEQGIRIAAGVILNTSRWFNALACAGVMRRAYLEAVSYARHRRAFGRSIGGFPAVAETLAVMKAEEQAALASTMELTALIDAIDRGRADRRQVAFHRVLVNANKYVTSVAATESVHRGIEILGGNGAIEDFSSLPRLYRDAIVFESWEGAHNVLCAQVRRDMQAMAPLDEVIGELHDRLAAVPDGDAALRTEAGHARTALANLQPRLQRSLGDEAFGERHFRRQLEALVRTVQVVCLLQEAAVSAARWPAAAAAKVAAAGLLFRRHLWASYEVEADPGHDARVAAVLADELAP